MTHTPPFLKISLVIALAISSTNMFSQNLPFWSNNGNNVSSTDFFGSTNSADLRFRTNNLARMTLTSAGTLRVNNLAGAGNGFVSLDVNGNLARTNFSGDTNQVLSGDGTFKNISSISGWAFANSYTGTNLYNINSGNVGIGTNSPSEKLSVNGNAIITGTLNVSGITGVQNFRGDTIRGNVEMEVDNKLCMDGGALAGVCTKSGDLLLQSHAGANGNTIMNTGTSGNVGIGLVNPVYKLDVNGDERVNGKIYSYRIVPLPGDSEIHFGDSSIVLSSHNIIYSNTAYLPNGTPIRGLGIGSIGDYAYGQNSIAIGQKVNTSSSANNSIVIGTGIISGSGLLTNTIPNSLMIGFNSTIPTFFVGTSSGANTTGKVGVGTATPQGDFQVGDGGTGKFCVLPGGRVTIGAAQITTGGLYDESFTKLTVDGRIMCKDIVISTTADWPDFVFDSAYKLMPIDVLGEFIKTNHHLPGSKSAVEIEKNGISLAELCKQQQMQIEQMALYIVQIDARLKVLEAAQTNGGK